MRKWAKYLKHGLEATRQLTRQGQNAGETGLGREVQPLRSLFPRGCLPISQGTIERLGNAPDRLMELGQRHQTALALHRGEERKTEVSKCPFPGGHSSRLDSRS